MGGMGILVIMSLLTTFYLLFLILIISGIIYSLVQYIFDSMFLKTVVEDKKYKILSWIPIGNKICLGKIANKTIFGYIMFLLYCINIILIYVSYTIDNISDSMNKIITYGLIIFTIIIFILDLITSHRIMKKAIPKYAPILTMINIITLGFTRPIFLWFNRKKIPKEN